MATKQATLLEAGAVAEAKQNPLGRVVRAFTYRDYRLFWFGAFTSSAGTWIQQTAQSWLLFQLTKDAFYLGLEGFLSMVPILLFSLIGGVIADRVDRRRILITSLWLQLSFAFALAILTAFGVSNRSLVVCILSLSFMTGCAQALSGPANQALVPMLVERRDMANAIALNSIQFNLARVIGPALASIPFALIPSIMVAASISFACNGFSFIAVMIALMCLRVQAIPRPENATENHWGSDLWSGLKFVACDEAIRSVTIISLASAFFGMQVTTFLPYFAEKIFQAGAGGYSLLLSMIGAGAVVGALAVAGLGDIKYKGRTALTCQITFGLLVAAFALTPWIWLAYPIAFLAGISMIFVFALTNSLVQLLVTDEMRGRVMSIYMVAFRGGLPLGSLVTGLLANQFGIVLPMVVGGILLTLLALGFLLSPSKVNNH